VHHDPSVSVPHAGGAAARAVLSDLTLAEIESLAHRGTVEVPTLAAVLELAEGRGKVYVELKGADSEGPVCRLLAGRERWTAVHGFDHRAPKRARALCPALPAGILLQSYLVDTAAALVSASATDLWQWHEFIDRALVRDVHAAGGRVIAWTVNDPTAARALAGLGVDGICTDLPAEMREAIAR
jgi:glycerophosphoryl diester phosphodiesterase